MCPSMFGFPCTRRRKLTIAVHKRIPFEKFMKGIPANPLANFGAPVVAAGDIYYWSSEADVVTQLDKYIAEGRTSYSGIAIGSFKELLTGLEAKHLREYEKHIAKDGKARRVHIMDLGQSLSFAKKTRTTIGCLLKRSRWWSHSDQRWLTGCECLALMGLDKNVCPWLFRCMSETEMVALAGNAFHVPSVGAVFLWLLSSGQFSVEKKP